MGAVNNLDALVQCAEYVRAIKPINHIRAHASVHFQCLNSDACVYACDYGVAAQAGVDTVTAKLLRAVTQKRWGDAKPRPRDHRRGVAHGPMGVRLPA